MAEPVQKIVLSNPQLVNEGKIKTPQGDTTNPKENHPSVFTVNIVREREYSTGGKKDGQAAQAAKDTKQQFGGAGSIKALNIKDQDGNEVPTYHAFVAKPNAMKAMYDKINNKTVKQDGKSFKTFNYDQIEVKNPPERAANPAQAEAAKLNRQNGIKDPDVVRTFEKVGEAPVTNYLEKDKNGNQVWTDEAKMLCTGLPEKYEERTNVGEKPHQAINCLEKSVAALPPWAVPSALVPAVAIGIAGSIKAGPDKKPEKKPDPQPQPQPTPDPPNPPDPPKPNPAPTPKPPGSGEVTPPGGGGGGGVPTPPGSGGVTPPGGGGGTINPPSSGSGTVLPGGSGPVTLPGSGGTRPK